MGPSIVSLGAAAIVAFAGHVAGARYTKSAMYDASNFFDKFDFITDQSNSGGFSTYLNQEDAVRLGIARVKNGRVILGVENSATLSADGLGRGTVRLESKKSFDPDTLLVGRFARLPARECGAWPRFGTVSDNGPAQSQANIYEGWNYNPLNHAVIFASRGEASGNCKLGRADQSGKILTEECAAENQTPLYQGQRQGCVVEDSNNPFGSTSGGVYAMEWTKEFVKIYSWSYRTAPPDIHMLHVNVLETRLWKPVAHLKYSNCGDVDDKFQDQRVVIDIDLCGGQVGMDGAWDQCRAKTQSTCAEYVAANPDRFRDVYWEVEDIRIFKPAKRGASRQPVSRITRPASDFPKSKSRSKAGRRRGGLAAASASAVKTEAPLATAASKATSKAASAAAAKPASNLKKKPGLPQAVPGQQLPNSKVQPAQNKVKGNSR